MALLKAPADTHPLVRNPKPDQKPQSLVTVTRENKPVSFPDAFIAINSAADSANAKAIIREFQRLGLQKRVVTDEISYSPPLFISVTSTADNDTKITWRFAQLWNLTRKTEGHDKSLLTHVFSKEIDHVSCQGIRNVPDFGQGFHCLRLKKPTHVATPRFAIDLPNRKRKDRTDFPDHARYSLQLINQNTANASLAWIFQVPPNIIEDHNDIYNFRSSLLIMAMIQLSGAVMSLAQEWKDTFESET